MGLSVYPTSIDTFTDPTSNDTMDGEVGGAAVYHDVQHALINDAVHALQVALGITGSFNFAALTGATFTGLIFPEQQPTASAPGYVKGALYFDTTLNKLRVGGATAWETVTSA